MLPDHMCTRLHVRFSRQDMEVYKNEKKKKMAICSVKQAMLG